MPAVFECDIPTAITPRETEVLSRLAARQTVLEAGALLGYSTICMARAAAHVFSIDPHEGYPEWLPNPTLDAFRENLRRYGVSGLVTVLVGKAEEIIPRIREPIGFAFLDLTGEFQVTLDCLEACIDGGIPLVWVHDYGRGGCSGATEAVDRVVRSRGLRARRVDSLVILEH